MKLMNFPNASLVNLSLTFLIYSAIISLPNCNSSNVYDSNPKAIIVLLGKRLLTKKSIVDCEKYVFHPHCRGLQAKKKRLDVSENEKAIYNNDNNDLNNNDNDNLMNKIKNVCFCKYHTKVNHNNDNNNNINNKSNWKKDDFVRSIELIETFKEIMSKENNKYLETPNLSEINRNENYNSYKQPNLIMTTLLSSIADKIIDSKNSLMKHSFLIKQSKKK